VDVEGFSWVAFEYNIDGVVIVIIGSPVATKRAVFACVGSFRRRFLSRMFAARVN
jgi:hypothetical protein